MKKYQTAKELLATKAENKEKKPIYATRKLSIGLVSCMLGLLLAAPNARAEEVPPAPGVEAAGQQEAPAKVEEDLLTDEEIQAIRDKANNQENDYYFNGNMVDELKAELRKAKADPSVNYEGAKARLIKEAIIKNTPAKKAPGQDRVIKKFQIKAADKLEAEMTEITVQGLGMEEGQKIEVLVNGVVKGTFTQPKNVKRSVPITLPAALQAGDKVKAVLKGSDDVQIAETEVATVKKKEPKKAEKYKDTLKMPTGEIWIEDTAASLPHSIEKNKALEMFWEKNADLKGDIKSVDFSINGDTNAYYKVTFDDKSTLKVEATKLKIKNPTEITPQPEIQQTFVADGNIVIKLKQKVAKGTAYGIVRQFTNDEPNKGYCNGTCKLDKTTTTWSTLDQETDTITYPVDKDFLQYGQKFGVVVKEYGKKSSCQSKSPEIKIPDLTGVRDPKKLTPEEKKTIDEAIRKANTRKDGASKLPDGFGGTVPAIIDISDDGNVKIINPSDVDGDWVDGNFVPKRNPDGSIIPAIGKQNPGIPIENTKIIENKAPEKPKVEVIGENVVVTPDNKDTDAKKVSVTYETPDGTKKTIIATKDSATNKWSVPKESDGTVDPDSGKITLPVNKVKGGSEVSASVTDDGFKANNQNPATSENGATTLPKVKTKAEQITELGGLDPVVMKKWVGDVIGEGFWKDGVKVKEGVSAENKKKIDDLLAGAKFDDFQEDASKEKRNTDKANNTTGFVGKIKVTLSDGSELVVENQTLYVSDHVTWFSKEKTPGGRVVFNENAPNDAIVAEFKLGKGTKIDNADGKTAIEGKESPVSYQKYKVKPGTDLKTYVHPTLQSTIYESINKKVKEQDDFIDPVWNTDNFKVTDSNKVFTATATEAFKVTVKPDGGTKAGGGKAEDIVTKVKKNGTYTLPAANTFNPPNENQEFAGWKVGDKEGVKKPNTPIDVKGNITITATWKPKSPGSGSGSGTGTGSGSGTGTGTGTGTGETATPGTTPEPSQPGNTPDPTPGSENPKDKPTDPAKNNPDPKDKPEDKKTGEDNKNNPKTPNVEKGDKVINVGDKEVVVPKVVVDKKKGKLDKEERTKIAEKIKQKNPDIVDVKIDENANAYVTFNDGRRERIPAKDLVSKEGFVIPRRDRHSQDESPNRRRAGKNVKTGVESIAGIACTLVASTGALYIGRKKED
ncbi:Gram-positive signal peptide protein, YSIRK family [Anaerococcus lactolyticus ATCC 51172]|uniref:Gram-positive signal peptide protein, YSIRK family n=1 Tax=Anaerococcus lactolyticus ATCC 51172 TaxID=525254 RepID=C2BHK5_9FIRM|nr:hypothetical protein [Anaerococcus lactolyticus]EEI85618.1 Gram-positive signal peptide protein, YSIRK family [Anaerococcus lactolyticus ATCC 51172]